MAGKSPSALIQRFRPKRSQLGHQEVPCAASSSAFLSPEADCLFMEQFGSVDGW